MLKPSVTPQEVCDLLNELLKLDYDCVRKLLSYREVCNELVANHPTVQVQQHSGDEFPTVGIVGILNGLFGTTEEGMGALCYEIEDDGTILGFKLTPPPNKE